MTTLGFVLAVTFAVVMMVIVFKGASNVISFFFQIAFVSIMVFLVVLIATYIVIGLRDAGAYVQW